ncbi:MAG TPA: hypothetical protein VGP70_09475 [Actinomadura sp.]|jgi:hypothetical protein|nr:hypothetical protein [Actinomadura sp.]
MPHDLPTWVAELTDPRRAQTLDELADRLVPLAEHAIDVSRRLQALLNELNEPFKSEELYGRVDRLKARTVEAIEEIATEISASGRERIERTWAALRERGAGERAGATLRARLEADVLPSLAEQERAVAQQVAGHVSVVLQTVTKRLLGRLEELAAAVTDLIHEVLPMAQEGLDLAGRVSALSGRARQAGRGPVTGELATEAAEIAGLSEATIARLELEWSALGARTATVRSAIRGAEEAAFSEVTTEMTTCVEKLAPDHIKVLNEAEARAMAMVDELAPITEA